MDSGEGEMAHKRAGESTGLHGAFLVPRCHDSERRQRLDYQAGDQTAARRSQHGTACSSGYSIEEGAEARLRHAQGAPDAVDGELVQRLAREVLGEVAEDEGGSVGRL